MLPPRNDGGVEALHIQRRRQQGDGFVTDLDNRVRERARKLWDEAGRPAQGADAFIDQASELVAIEDNQRRTTRPLRPGERGAPDAPPTLSPDEAGPSGEPVEPVIAIENAGEFPTMTDQGEEQIPRRGR
jgi:hypothetical protein